MQTLVEDSIKRAKDVTAALNKRKQDEQKRTMSKPFWERTSEEKAHTKRISKATENLEHVEGD